MAHSLESRVPFLTPKLVNFLFSLPENYIIGADSVTKAVFRSAMQGILPEPIRARRDKIGFATPELSWLTTLNPWVEKVLKSETAQTIPVLNIEVIQQEWQAVLQQKSPFDFRVWRWLNIIKWAEQNQITFD